MTDAVLVNTPEQLGILADSLGVRPDWHEPDEQDVSAQVFGDHLDNAMGAQLNGEWIIGGSQELVVLIRKDGYDIAQINLASLLAWASAAHRTPKGN